MYEFRTIFCSFPHVEACILSLSPLTWSHPISYGWQDGFRSLFHSRQCGQGFLPLVAVLAAPTLGTFPTSCSVPDPSQDPRGGPRESPRAGVDCSWFMALLGPVYSHLCALAN